jgi:signal transduction histidine kinase
MCIRDRSQVALRLETERSRYHELFAFAPDPILVTNREGVLLEANEAACVLLAAEARFLPGKPLQVYLRGNDIQRVQRALDAALAGDAKAEVTAALHAKNGNVVRTALRIAKTGDPDRVLWSARPAPSEERESVPPPPAEVEHLVAERTRDLEGVVRDKDRAIESERRGREAAERASVAKDQSLAVLSHELRGPIHAILGWTKLLRDSDLPPESRERGVSVIERNARVQADLIEALLDLSRVATQRLRLNRSVVDLGDIVASVADGFEPEAEKRRVRLTIDVQERLLVNGDPLRLRQVATNLIGNALRYTQAGGHVHVCTERRNGFGYFTVVDNGRGIPTELIPTIFECFQQGNDAAMEGLGLGLYIVRKLVELHGGAVSVESEGRGHGSKFTVALPTVKDKSSASK